MTRWSRYGYLALVWLFVAGLVVQVFLAGMGMFVDPRDWQLHVDVGWSLAHLVPLLILVTAALGRLGRRTLALAVVLLVSSAVQPFLPGLRESFPLMAALHPLNAFVMFGIALKLALDATSLIRFTAGEAA